MEASAWGRLGAVSERPRTVPPALAPARVHRQAALRGLGALPTARAHSGRGGAKNKDAIMSLPGGNRGRSPRGPGGEGGVCGGGGAGPTARTRAGAASQPAVGRPRISRWSPCRASSVGDATWWCPVPVPTCAFRVLLLRRHLGAEPVAWEMPITNPAGRARGLEEEASGRAVVLPLPPAPPPHKSPRLCGPGEPLIKVPEPAWTWLSWKLRRTAFSGSEDVASLVYSCIYLFAF